MEKKPIRIAQVIGKMLAGGVENVVFNYYREIDKNIIQFDFFYDSDSIVEPPKELIELGARFYKIPPYQSLFKYMKSLYRIFKENKYQIVHSHINTLSVFPLFIAKIAGIPVRIAHNHSVPDGQDWNRNIIKNILRIFSKIYSTDYFACSEKAGRWLFGNKCYKNGEVYLLKNAINFEKYNIDKNIKEEILNRYNIKGNLIVGHVGRFTLAKNHTLLLKIFKEIVELQNDAILLLVGDGELKDKIIELIKELDLDNNVIMVGKVSNAEIYYSVMDVILIPSIFEGLSLTAIEAQASLVPVIASYAVPSEARISSGFYYMDLKESPFIWAQKVLEVFTKQCRLTTACNDYNIKKTTRDLEHWYINKYTCINNE